jgi:phosphoribosylpyrophosphate synthetase
MAVPFPRVEQLLAKPIPLSTGYPLSVYYLGSYWPTRYGYRAKQENSVQLLALKNGDANAARYFAAKLSAVLVDAPRRNIVAMPSHGVGCAPANRGLRLIISMVPGVIDLSGCLTRHKAVPKSSKARSGQRPTRETHIGSMRIVDAARINGQDILLLDDVVTLGASMSAAWAYLDSAGAKSVTCLALTKTEGYD